MLWGRAEKGKLSMVSKGSNSNRQRWVKVFGERNTGTRAVVWMLRALNGVTPGFPNYQGRDLDALQARVDTQFSGFQHEMFNDALDDVRRSRMGAHSAWKHAAPQVDDSYAAKGASVLFMVRDPYSWIAALYRNPYHARAPRPDTLAQFLEQPWLTMQRDNIAPILMSPMELWNEKLRAYRAFAEAAPVPSTVLAFEDFVLAPVEALGAALQRFDIPVEGLAEIPESTKKRGKTRAQRLAYYKARAWEREVSTDAARLVNEYVNWDVAAHFGYAQRDPADFR